MKPSLLQNFRKHPRPIAAVLAFIVAAAAAQYDLGQQRKRLTQITLEIQVDSPANMHTIIPNRAVLRLQAANGKEILIHATDFTSMVRKSRSRLRFEFPAGQYESVTFIPDPSLGEITIYELRLISHDGHSVAVPLNRVQSLTNLETASRTQAYVSFRPLEPGAVSAANLLVTDLLQAIQRPAAVRLAEIIFAFFVVFGLTYFAFLSGIYRFRSRLESSGELISQGPLLRFGVIIGLVACMAASAARNAHPDEFLHVQAAQYYVWHWLPASLTSEEVAPTISHFGLTYLAELDVGYLVAGKFAFFARPLFPDIFTTLRFFNVILLTTVLIWTIEFFAGSPSTWIFLITPQFWYVFAGYNTEGWAIFVSLLLIGQLVRQNSSLQRYLLMREGRKDFLSILPALFLSCLLILSKRNFLLVFLFYAIWLLWRAISLRSQPNNFRRIMRMLPLILIPFILRFGLQIYQTHVNGNDLGRTITEQAEKYAEPEFKPSVLEKSNYAEAINTHMKQRGVPLKDLFFRYHWLYRITASFVGTYGWLTFYSATWFYVLMAIGWTIIIGLALIGTFKDSTKTERLFSTIAWLHLPLIAALALYFAWTGDFQAQGRYLFPFLPILFYLLNRERFFGRSFASLTVWGLFCISVYGFIFFGLWFLVERDFLSG